MSVTLTRADDLINKHSYSFLRLLCLSSTPPSVLAFPCLCSFPCSRVLVHSLRTTACDLSIQSGTVTACLEIRTLDFHVECDAPPPSITLTERGRWDRERINTSLFSVFPVIRWTIYWGVKSWYGWLLCASVFLCNSCLKVHRFLLKRLLGWLQFWRRLACCTDLIIRCGFWPYCE